MKNREKETIKTKKLIVPFDLDNPNKRYKGFLYPNILEKETTSFLQIDKDKKWKTGMVVFIGKEVTKNDLFAKIIDSGKKIESVSNLLDTLDNFLGQINNFKIGNIVGIKDSFDGFELTKLKKPPRINTKLP